MKRILIVYHSQEHTHTAAMAEQILHGIRQVEGVEAVKVNTNQGRVDMDAAEAADGYALGSPDYYTYMAGGLKQFFDDICLANMEGRKVAHKPYVAFMSHGGGGGAIDSIENLARSMKLEQVAPSILHEGEPDAETVNKCVELGRALAERVSRT
jgi:flavorubredoxin